MHAISEYTYIYVWGNIYKLKYSFNYTYTNEKKL